MVRKVLIVDDDRDMLHSLREGLAPYDETFSLHMADDGVSAIEILKTHPVSLLVTDLKMPQMDGFGLLTHVMENYPEVPVIIMTGYSTPEMEKLAMEGGAVGYIEKPFKTDALARTILSALRKEADGGTLHNVSSGMFLQLVEMEQKTCTIRLMDRVSGNMGVLFFQEGELVDARTNGSRGETAAYEIFSWDQVSLAIQNECRQKEKRIRTDLQAILLEAMRLKDEGAQLKESEPSDEMSLDEEDIPSGPVSARGEFMAQIRARLLEALGDRCGLSEVFESDEWDGVIAQMSRIGKFFGVGDLRLGFVERDDSGDLVLLPGEKTTLISLSPKCPRERIIQTLCG